MANQNKDRVTGETLAHFLASDAPPATARPAEIGVSLWTSPTARLDCRASRHKSPLLNLVVDLIRSSGGVQGPETSDLVVATFPDANSGLLCAKRVQWALEGLAEYDPFKTAAAAVSVDFADERHAQGGSSGQRGAQNPTRENVDPGQILLSRSIAEQLGHLPGVVLDKTTAGGYRSWSWNIPQSFAGFAEDEQVVLNMIQAAGKTDPSPAKPAASVASPSSASVGGEAGRTRFSSRALNAAAPEGLESREGKARMPILVGSVAVLLVGAFLFYFFAHKASVQGTAAGQGAPPAQGGPASPGSPAQETRPARPEPHPRPSTKEAKRPAKVDAAPEPKPVEMHCDLTAADIQRSLDRAESYMHGGNLPSATAAFQHVLGCPSAHEKAQEGLNRIQRMAQNQ